MNNKKKLIIGGVLLTPGLIGSAYGSTGLFPHEGVECNGHYYPATFHDWANAIQNNQIDYYYGNYHQHYSWVDYDVTEKHYDKKKDLGLPLLGKLKLLSSMGFEKNSGTYTKNQVARHWNYDIFTTDLKNNSYSSTNPGYYNLYTSNGQKWGICRAYYIVGGNRTSAKVGRRTNSSSLNRCNDARNHSRGSYNGNVVYDYINSSSAIGNIIKPGTVYGGDQLRFEFWFPFATDINGEVKNKLNIISNAGHLNGNLDPSNIELHFTFY